MRRLTNWAGNFHYSTDNVLYPQSMDELQRLVRSVSKARVMGTRHSFNRIGDSIHALISLEKFGRVIQINSVDQSVTVGGSVRYGELAAHLHAAGFALHNLGSLPHISVAGACVSATHGSGVKNGILATAVTSLELVTADGEVKELFRERDEEIFDGCVVNLGALGVVTKLTLRIHPTYYLKQEVYENLPLHELYRNLVAILSLGYSVSLFTDWTSEFINQVWIKTRVENNAAVVPRLPVDFFGATPARKNVHPIPSMPAENCTEQMAVQGAWHERLPHFRMEFTPSSGEELQSEYFVPMEHAESAIKAIYSLRHRIAPFVLISELRTIDADSLWMSPCYNRASLAVHFTWRQDWENVRKLLPLIESALASFDYRTHWGKLFAAKPSLIQSSYERLPDFRKLMIEFDPEGKFRNEFIEENVFRVNEQSVTR